MVIVVVVVAAAEVEVVVSAVLSRCIHPYFITNDLLRNEIHRKKNRCKETTS